jgi:ABC-type nitrate/sulfonate/bicarbonate transport system permease component
MERPEAPAAGRATLQRWLYPLLLAALMVLAWEAGVRALALPHYILPAPSEVLATLVDKREVFLRHSAVTLLEVVAGGLLGVAVGFLLGLALFFSPVLE